jgi:hypothetical protein
LDHRNERNIVIGTLDLKATKLLQQTEAKKEVESAGFLKYKAKELSAKQQEIAKYKCTTVQMFFQKRMILPACPKIST